MTWQTIFGLSNSNLRSSSMMQRVVQSLPRNNLFFNSWLELRSLKLLFDRTFFISSKKVLLRDRKRRTACHIASTFFSYLGEGEGIPLSWLGEGRSTPVLARWNRVPLSLLGRSVPQPGQGTPSLSLPLARTEIRPREDLKQEF